MPSEVVALDWRSWQQSWDLQQEAYMPDREERFAALFDVVEAQCGSTPRVLDLAGGTGSITRRLLAWSPSATSIVLDLDPALLRIASATFAGDDRVRVVRADLSSPSWLDAVGREPFDAVLTTTALHWLSEQRLAALYSEIPGVLRSGGVFCNADHMVDPGLPALTSRLESLRRDRREQQYASGEVLSWPAWWKAARQDPGLADAVAERDRIYGGTDHGDTLPELSRHVELLTAAGFAEVGLIWRGLTDAAVAAVKA